METRGFFVGRRPFAEYDEEIAFLSERFSLIKARAFGSRSPFSRRGRLLSNLGLFRLHLSKKSTYLLDDLELIRPLSFINSLSLYRGYFSLMQNLGVLLKFAPSLEREHRFLDSVLIEDFFNPFLGLEYELILMAIEKDYGNLPMFHVCSKCGKICSENYYYDLYKEEFTGDVCLEKKEAHSLEVNYESLMFLAKFHSKFVMNLDFMLEMKGQLKAVSFDFLRHLSRTRKLAQVSF